MSMVLLRLSMPVWMTFVSALSTARRSSWHLGGEKVQQRADLVGAVRGGFHARLDSGGFHLGYGGGELRELFRHGGDVEGFHHQKGGFRFNADFLVEYFRLDFMAGVELHGADHLVFFKEGLGLGRFQRGQGFNGAGNVGQFAAFRFFNPGFPVAVSAEKDALVLLDDVLKQLVQRGMEFLRLVLDGFQDGADFIQGFPPRWC